VTSIDARYLRLARRRGWLIPIRSRGTPRRATWRPPVVAETELLRQLVPELPIHHIVLALTVHRARVREALTGPVQFARVLG
jgi:hypothetical protein